MSAFQQVASQAIHVIPSDTTRHGFAYLYVGTGGDLAFYSEGSPNLVTMVGVPDGSYVWCRVNRIMATGTTASDIVGFA